MGASAFLTTFHVQVARIFFGLQASDGYLVAGGAGLLASDLIARSTEDIDLFASPPTSSVIEAKIALLEALHHRGHEATVLQEADLLSNGRATPGCGAAGGYCDRLATDQHANHDFARADPRPKRTGRSKAAGTLWSSGGPRLRRHLRPRAQRFGKDALLEQAQALDAGFDRVVLSQMLGTLGRFTDDEIPLAASELDSVQAFFAAWAEELQ